MKTVLFWIAAHAPWLHGRRNSAALLNLHAKELIDQGRFDAALPVLERALAMSPDLAMAWHNRGVCRLELSRFDDALADFDRSLAMQPDYGDSLGFRASALASLGRYDEAGEAFFVAGRQGAAMIFIHLRRGMMHVARKDWAAALMDFDAACKLEPDNELSHNNRGFALMKLGRFAEALEEMQTARDLNPEHPFPYKNLAWLRATCPDPAYRDGAEAIRNALAARECTGNQQSWLPLLGAAQAAAHAERGEFGEAIRIGKATLQHMQASPPMITMTAAQDELRRQLDYYQRREPYRDADIANGSETMR